MKLSGFQSRQLCVDCCGPLLASKQDESMLGLIDHNRKRIREHGQEAHKLRPAWPNRCHPIEWNFGDASLDVEFMGLEYKPLIREVQPATYGLNAPLQVRAAVSNKIFVNIQFYFHAHPMLDSGRPEAGST
jgi:hypothetical protein